MTITHPRIVQVVLDTTDCRGLAEFYREMLGLEYCAGDEPTPGGEPDDKDWLTLRNATGRSYIGSAFLNPDLVGTAPAAFEPGMPRSVLVSLTVGRLR